VRIEEHDGKEERKIVTAMVVNDYVVGRVSCRYAPDLFDSPWANLVASWCHEFYQRYRKAPGHAIEGLYDRWASRGAIDEATSELVGKFIGTLLEEYDRSDEINGEYLVDLAGKHFNRVRLKRLFTAGADALEAGELDFALEKVNNYRHVELGTDALVDPYTDIDIHIRTLLKSNNQQVEYPGKLAKFFYGLLGRDCFVVFQAPMKRTKSFWVYDVAHRALMQRRRVLYLQIGDMGEDQVTRRLEARLCYRPVRKGTYRYPTSFKRTADKQSYEIKFATRTMKDDLTLEEIRRAQEKFRKHYLRSKRSYFQMLITPTMSVADIRARIQHLQVFDDWTPDVIALDYADLLAPPKGVIDKREQINENWKQLRMLNLETHSLLVTATQSNSKAHKQRSQGRDNFSDNQLKMAHVTSMLGINATEDERDDDVARLNVVVSREGASREGAEVFTASCLSLANPAVLCC
jgi:uncharacterized protein YnzC (UPF0291/DUF896 family)